MVGYFICFLFLSEHKTSIFKLYLFTRPYVFQTKQENVIKGHWNMWAFHELGGMYLHGRELKGFQRYPILSSQCPASLFC